MPLQRTYSLPSCTLVIEGIGSSQALSILTNFDCRFPDSQQAISGGRNLLLAMFEAVNESVLGLQDNLQFKPLANPVITDSANDAGSSVRSALTETIINDKIINDKIINDKVINDKVINGKTINDSAQPRSKVFLKPVSAYEYLLQVQAIAEDSDRTDLIKIPLSMVQLFDLMDSFDQLCLDPQTLPDLVLALKVDDIKPRKATKVQTIPILVGAASLAIAVGAAVIILPPLFKQPEPQPASDLPPNSRTVIPTAPKPPGLSALNPSDKILAEAQITDPNLIEEIQSKLRNNIDRAWRNQISFKRDLTYIVAANQDGEILSFEPTAATKKALEPDAELKLEKLDQELPLKQLRVEKDTPIQPDSSISAPNQKNVEMPKQEAEKTAKFTVTFSPNRGGKLTVKPVKVDP